jgi:hypothetical protein
MNNPFLGIDIGTGSARLARLGYGAGPLERAFAAPPVLRVVEPGASLRETFCARKAHYRALDRARRTSFKEIAQ